MGAVCTDVHDRTHRRVLCCAECEQPLRRLASGGAYCDRCGYAPSMQDTFIRLEPGTEAAGGTESPAEGAPSRQAGSPDANGMDHLYPGGRRPAWLPKEK